MNTKNFTIDHLKVFVLENRQLMGQTAAIHVADEIKKVVSEKGNCRIVFAAAVSQSEFLEEFLKIEDIPWEKLIAFHMDEYHTLDNDAPQRFGNFLKERLFKHRPFGQVHYMGEDATFYSSLINEAPIDIVCLGIGENGHLAFNDPPVADFNDPETVKEVELDQVCRQQQVNDGEFSNLEDVPNSAITLTMPALLNAKFLSVVVPGTSKAVAVRETLYGEISTACPSTALRTHPRASLFLDTHSSHHLTEDIS